MGEPRECPDEQELCDLARGTIPAERGAALRDHIGDCAACRMAVAELTSTVTTSDPADTPDGDGAGARYELRRLVATGGMGEVYLALDRVLGREVAIKLLHEDASSPDGQARTRRRVLREAQALASFAHPNVVAVYDLGVLDRRPFLAMEYVRGRTLRQWIAEDKPDVDRVADVLGQAGRGLIAAHEIGLVHRDFKPDNVLVGEDGRARVTDFGLARMAQAETPSADKPSDAPPAMSVTIDGAISGTPAYMAPEQIAGRPADARSDQYAFCVTLSEAIHGRRPGFPGVPSSSSPSSRATVKDARRLARIDAAIARGLSPDPDDRFFSMRSLLAELEATAAEAGGSRKERAVLLGAAAALVAMTAGGWVLVHRTHAAASPGSPAALHSPCGGTTTATCPSPLVCGYPAGNLCGASGAAGECQWPTDGCDAKSSAMCGCDSVAYANVCEANRHASSVAYRGSCTACTAAEACADVTVGRGRTPTFCRVAEGATSGPTQSAAGVCWPRPSACPAGGAVVCGWDGRTYENVCEARRAGFDMAREGRCAGDTAAEPNPPPVAAGDPVGARGLTFGAPDEQGVDARPLMSLASFLEAEKLPIYSLLISRNGVLIYELYTSSLTRDEAHYLMGITGTITSALVGAAIDRHLVAGPETTVADALPADLFPSPADRERFRKVTLRDVLGMSALDAPIPPHDRSEPAQERQRQFLASPNRAAFALTQAILPEPGVSFQYTDITSLLATGILEYATRRTALDLAEEAFFKPMEFRSYEWMHQDSAGIDNGAYGLRLRPVDMQKFGVLYLARGLWKGERLLSSDWVLRSFSPWIKSSEGLAEPNYGWHWQSVDYAPEAPSGQARDRHWVAHLAQGWKGQRIAVFVDKALVVTMTGVVEPPEDEAAVFRRIVRDYVIPAVDGTGAAPAHPDASLRAPMAALLERVRTEPLPLKRPPEPRMVPSIEPKGNHHAFQPH